MVETEVEHIENRMKDLLVEETLDKIYHHFKQQFNADGDNKSFEFSLDSMDFNDTAINNFKTIHHNLYFIRIAPYNFAHFLIKFSVDNAKVERIKKQIIL